MDPARAASDLQESSFPQGAAADSGFDEGFDLGEQTLHVCRISHGLRLLYQRADLRKCFTRAHGAAAVRIKRMTFAQQSLDGRATPLLLVISLSA